MWNKMKLWFADRFALALVIWLLGTIGLLMYNINLGVVFAFVFGGIVVFFASVSNVI